MNELNQNLSLLRIDQPNYQPDYKTIESFEQFYDGMGAINFAWHQGKFSKLGSTVYPKYKVDLIKEFINNFSANGKKIDPLGLLKKISPEITNQWLEEMK